MSLVRFCTLIITTLLAGLTITLSACQKGGSSGGSGGSPAPGSETQFARAGSGGGGGIDGSGGDSIQSTLEEVKKAFADEMKLLPKRLGTLASRHRNNEKVIYDYQFSKGSYDLIGAFINPPNQDAHESALLKGLREGLIQILPQVEACATAQGHHAGRAKGDVKKGEICISYKKLQNLSPKVLNEEIFFLLIHELSHLVGFNEAKAVEIQKLIGHNRQFYSHYEDSGYMNGLIACSRKAIDDENAAMEASPYWQARLKELSDLLIGSQPRGCGQMSNGNEDKIAIFADDAEFLAVTGKFPRAGYRYWDKQDNPDPKIALGSQWVQDLTIVASVFLRTPTATILDLAARVGTDAQCSPKILVANLIANIPDVLQLGCGADRVANSNERIKARIAKEREILANENK